MCTESTTKGIYALVLHTLDSCYLNVDVAYVQLKKEVYTCIYTMDKSLYGCST